MGGEAHTFTQLKQFGGGFVDALNQASGNPVPAPECAQFVNGVLTPQRQGPDNLFISAGSSAMASTSPARRSTSLSVLYSSMDAFCGERRRPRPSSLDSFKTESTSEDLWESTLRSFPQDRLLITIKTTSYKAACRERVVLPARMVFQSVSVACLRP